MADAHVLIAGMTLSGKSTIARELAAAYKAADVGVIVCDPIGDPRWGADYMTTEGEPFLRTAKASWQCALFIDESGAVVGRYNKPMEWLATQSRHYGHRAHFITQRPAQISPTVRAQCSRLLLFAAPFEDCKTLAREWNKPELVTACDLPAGHFFDVSRFKAPVLRRVF